jgi:hypothetical protein
MKENPPEKVDLSKVVRNILSEKPRVTRVPIRWDNLDEAPEPAQDEQEEINDDVNLCQTSLADEIGSFPKEMEA